jgi:hypothetical protein
MIAYRGEAIAAAKDHELVAGRTHKNMGVPDSVLHLALIWLQRQHTAFKPAEGRRRCWTPAPAPDTIRLSPE